MSTEVSFLVKLLSQLENGFARNFVSSSMNCVSPLCCGMGRLNSMLCVGIMQLRVAVVELVDWLRVHLCVISTAVTVDSA